MNYIFKLLSALIVCTASLVGTLPDMAYRAKVAAAYHQDLAQLYDPAAREAYVDIHWHAGSGVEQCEFGKMLWQQGHRTLARQFFCRSAAQNDAEGIYWYAVALHEHPESPADKERSCDVFDHIAYTERSKNVCYEVGKWYLFGQNGRHQNLVEAGWNFALAADQGIEESGKYFDCVMTSLKLHDIVCTPDNVYCLPPSSE